CARGRGEGAGRGVLGGGVPGGHPGGAGRRGTRLDAAQPVTAPLARTAWWSRGRAAGDGAARPHRIAPGDGPVRQAAVPISARGCDSLVKDAGAARTSTAFRA